MEPVARVTLPLTVLVLRKFRAASSSFWLVTISWPSWSVRVTPFTNAIASLTLSPLCLFEGRGWLTSSLMSAIAMSPMASSSSALASMKLSSFPSDLGPAYLSAALRLAPCSSSSMMASLPVLVRGALGCSLLFLCLF